MKPKRNNKLTILLFSVYLLLLTWLILFKLQIPFDGLWIEPVRSINLIPYGSSIRREIYQNIFIFIPLGIYLCLLNNNNWPFPKKILSILGLSLAFEILQYIFSIGRSDITDVINNTLGGIIGIGIYMLLYIILKDKTNRIIRILALVVTIGVLLVIILVLATNRFPRFI